MPLWKEQPYAAAQPALGLQNDVPVLLIRFTGEVFQYYEDYCKKLSLYRKRAWTCRLTGTTGLTYEEALACEARANGELQEVPEWLEEPLLHLVHHATTTLDGLIEKALGKFSGRYVVGEELAATDEGKERPCVIRAITSAKRPEDEEGPEAERLRLYDIQWLDEPSIAQARIGEEHLIRRHAGLSEDALSGWITKHADVEAIQDVKDVPCVWRVKAPLAELYGLPTELPDRLVKKLQAPQKQLELARKPKKAITPNAAKPARAFKKPKAGASSQDAEDALRLKAEGAAIAAAVFASVSQAGPHQAAPGQEGHELPGSEPSRPKARARKPKRRADASPEDAEDTLRMKAEAARIAAEAFAVIPQSPDDDGDAEQLPKPKKVKRKRESELPADPEEALRLKAEAARIAAEVFASAGSAAEAPEDEEGTKKRRKSVGRRKKVQLSDGETPLVDPDDPAFMPGAQKEQHRPVLVLPPDAENIPGLKPETIEETEKRMEEKTVKWVLFQALKEAGYDGADTGQLVEAVHASGVKAWEDQRIAKSSVASSCTHDPAFVRLQKGRFALRALRPDLEEVAVSVILQRAANRQGGLAAAAATRNATADGSGQPQLHKNSFKCSKCHRMHHQQNSPLVLCDVCPRSFHVMCLELEFAQLPEDGEWACPKCLEKEAKQARREGRTAGGPLTEKEREERRLRKELDKAEKLLSRHQAREDKENVKQAEKEERDKAREVTRRNASRMAMEDLQVLEDEQINLSRAAERLLSLREEAKALAEKGPTAGEPAPEGGGEGPPGAASQEALVQDRLREAEEKVAHLNTMIAGPPPLEPLMRDPSAHTCLMNALAVSEFLATFGVLCEASRLSLQDLQQAASSLAHSSTLAQLYASLLRCVLLEKVGQEGYMRSRARRWARVVDDATWPEVLRRYLLATRAMLPQPSLQELASDVSCIDDDAAAVMAASLLSEQSFLRMGPALHLRLLLVLCNDVASGGALRAEFQARIDEVTHLSTQHRQLLIEERKQQAAAQKQAAEAQAAAEARAAAEAAEADAKAADADMPPGEAGSSPRPEEASKVKAEAAENGASDSKQAPVDPRLQEPTEEEREQREAEFEEQLRMRVVRSDLIGRDRHFRRYWWLQGEDSALWVEEADGSAVAVIAEQGQLEGLMCGLNRRGMRERALLNVLRRRQKLLTEGMSGRAPAVVPDVLQQTDSAVPDRQAAAEAEMEAAAIRSAATQLKTLLSETQAQQVILAAPFDAWEERLGSMKSPDDLIDALRDLEQELNKLGDGLPRDARDEFLGHLLQNGGQHAGAATVTANPEPPTQDAAGPAQNGQLLLAAQAADGDADNAAVPGASQAQLPNGASMGGTTGSAVALASHPSAVAMSGQALHSQGQDSSRGPSEEPDQDAGQQPWSYSAEPSRAQSMDLDGGSEAEAHAPRPESGRRPKYVTPVDELDNSDVESAQRDSRRIGLWRSGRERGVWLLDIQRAAAARSVCAAAYAASVIRDRMQPLLHRFSKRIERAARAEAAAEAAEAAALEEAAFMAGSSDNSSGDEAPLLQRKAEGSAAASKGPSKPPQPKNKSKLKLKLKVGGVAVDNGKPRKEGKGSKKASRGSTPATDAATTSGGEEAEDRWDFECIECGQEGDPLLCCEAKNCRTVMHPECAGLPSIPEDDWFCPKHRHALSGKGGKAAKKPPAKPAQASADKPRAKGPAKEAVKPPKKQHKKERKEKDSSLARQSSAEGSAPAPKKKRKLVKAGELHRQLESHASGPAKDKAAEPAVLAKAAARKQEGKPAKPSLGLKVKLKKAKAPE